ncbi:MAG: hypothetical protein MJE63_06295 [Proteobacteria bacterium]|nr:hypothetical protein [Pseudomonadota bacterium]
MLLVDRQKIYTPEEIGEIESILLQQILACGTSDAVEACIAYSRFLSLTGITNENYPLFIKVLEVGNHWVIDALIGERDPFLFLSSIQPNYEILKVFFKLLAARHPGELYAKSLSVILGVLQTTYNVPEDGFKIYRLTISDLNSLGKHLDEEVGQEDSLNRVILDILFRISMLQGRLGSEGLEGEDRDKEELAIHAKEIMNFFFDDTKQLRQVIPQVLLIRKDFRKNEILPRDEVRFEDSKLFQLENMGEEPYTEDEGEVEAEGEVYEDEEEYEEVYEEEEYEEEEPEGAGDEDLEPEPA